jgi:hypothetical protein
LGRSQFPPSSVERRVVARVYELGPSERTFNGQAWEELCALASILARFEQYYRAGPRVLPYLAVPLRKHRGDLSELARALVPRPSLLDLDAVGRVAIEDHLHIRDASELHIGPTFAQKLRARRRGRRPRLRRRPR